jgi:hypothetical protein
VYAEIHACSSTPRIADTVGVYRLVEVAVDCNLVERSGKSDLAWAVRLISPDEPVEALQRIHQQPARFASPYKLPRVNLGFTSLA